MLISIVAVQVCIPTDSECPHPRQDDLSVLSLILASLTGVRWNLRVALICFSLMAKDVEYFFKCFSAF